MSDQPLEKNDPIVWQPDAARCAGSQMQAFMEFQAKGKIEKRTINTRHILFIASGAFDSLTDVIKRRVKEKFVEVNLVAFDRGREIKLTAVEA